MGAPRKVPGIGVRADPRAADEKRGHDKEGLHGAYSVLGCYA
jgi:hypothetical protein